MATLSTPFTRVKATRKSKVPRTIRLLAYLPDVAGGLLQVTEGERVERYFFRRLPSDFGLAFAVEKYLPASEDAPARLEAPYHVCLDGEATSCECRGYNRWGHCRHVCGLASLIEHGKLPS